jgi:hypothetical protein
VSDVLDLRDWLADQIENAEDKPNGELFRHSSIGPKGERAFIDITDDDPEEGLAEYRITVERAT